MGFAMLRPMIKKTLLVVLAMAMMGALLACPYASLGRNTSTSHEAITRVLSREASLLPSRTRIELANTVGELSRKYKIDPLLILAIMSVESNFKPFVRSNRGAVGLMQIKPIVVLDVAHQMGLAHLSPHQVLMDPSLNARVGTHYFKNLLVRFKGNLSKALKAYNEGPTRVAHLYSEKESPVTGYARKVLEDYKRFQEMS